MPTAVIGFLVSEVVGAALAETVLAQTFVFGTLSVARVVSGLAGLVASGVAKSVIGSGKPDAPAATGATVQAQGRNVTIRQPISSWQVIYGQRRVGGVLTFAQESSDKQYFHLIVTFAGHVCQEISTIYFDDQVVPLDGSGNATGTFADHVRIQKSLGDEAGQPFPDLVTDSGGTWTSAHRQTGRTKIYVRLKANPNLFPTGVPNITAIIKGKKVVDYRSSPTPAAAYSTNVALCVADYMTDTAFGMGISSSELDMATLAAAANVCDESVNLNGSPGASETRYTCNGAFSTSATPKEILEIMLSAMGGKAVDVGGKWHIFAGAYEAPSITLDDGDLRGSLRVQSLISRRDNANAVKGVFTNRNNLYQPTDFPPIISSTYLAEDNNERVWKDIDLSAFVTSGTQAQRIAKQELLRLRQALTVSATFSLSAYRVMAGGTVGITNERYGWTDKAFEVTGSRFSVLPDLTLGVELDLRETASAVYDWSTSDEQEVDLAPNTDLPDPTAGLDISGLTLSSGTADLMLNGDGTVVPRIRATWTAPTSPWVSHYNVQFARSSGSPQVWVDAPNVGSSSTEGFAFPVTDGLAYNVRVRAVSVLNNAGAWSQVSGHTVIGKTQVPSNVTGFSAQQNGSNVNFRWAQISDVDLAGYEIRYNDEGNTTWESAQVVTSVTRGTAITNGFVPPGTWELLIKARDTSFNYSAAAASTTITVVQENEVVASVSEAPQWNGLKENFVRHWTGALVPDSQTLASAAGAELFDECVPNPYATCTYTGATLDGGFDDTVRIWADIISLNAPDAEEPDDPEFQLDYRTEAGSFDGFENWTIGIATGRYFLPRFSFDTGNGILIFTDFNAYGDQDESVRHDESVAIAAGGTDITFSPPFHAVPNLQVSAHVTGSPTQSRTAYYESVTTTGARIHVTTSAGTDVGGTVDWQATGT